MALVQIAKTTHRTMIPEDENVGKLDNCEWK